LPTVTSIASSTPGTTTSASLGTSEPSWSSSLELRPAHATDPSPRTAHTWLMPPPIEAGVVGDMTAGSRFCFTPGPTASPSALSPQHDTEPASRTAQNVLPPAASACASGRSESWSGLPTSVSVPSPNSARPFAPQHQRSPAAVRTQSVLAAAAMSTTPDTPGTGTGTDDATGRLPSPSCPTVLSPQQLTVPAIVRAQVKPKPGATSATPVSPLTTTGDPESTVSPLPSAPPTFEPQHRTVASSSTAQVRLLPTPIDTAESMPATAVGAPSSPPMVPLPSCPSKLSPQQITCPPSVSAHVWLFPAASCTTPPRPGTAAGVGWLLPPVVPSPSWPRKLSPQHDTVCVARSAQVWFVPVATAVAVLIESTVPGGSVSDVNPRPSWPDSFPPQHSIPPDVSTAHAVEVDTAIVPSTSSMADAGFGVGATTSATAAIARMAEVMSAPSRREVGSEVVLMARPYAPSATPP
jgi:hypothetical protein